MRFIIKNILLIGAGVCFLTVKTFAQLYDESQLTVSFTLPPVTLLDIEPATNNSLYFAMSPALESGASPQFTETSNEELWLNYSSAVQNANGSRAIVAQISGGSLPEGISLNVEASQSGGQGKGQLGQPAGKVALSGQPQTLIADIGNCFTGDGVGQGHQLTFTIELSDFSRLHAMSETVVVVLYTIVDF